MSVTSGVFFGAKRSVVGGAPRSNGNGQVVFFAKKNDLTFDVQLILNGEQFASSFGYSLTSLDINSDGTVVDGFISTNVEMLLDNLGTPGNREISEAAC